MSSPRTESWSVRKCAKVCKKCNRPFNAGESICSLLLFEEGEFLREDYCSACFPAKKAGLSSWKTCYTPPASSRSQHPLEKKTAETLLRTLIATEDKEDQAAIFILAVMLERKKLFIERAVQTTPEGEKNRIYEHRKTGEIFVIIDPELQLADLETVQEKVVVLLGGTPRSTSA